MDGVSWCWLFSVEKWCAPLWVEGWSSHWLTDGQKVWGFLRKYWGGGSMRGCFILDGVIKVLAMHLKGSCDKWDNCWTSSLSVPALRPWWPPNLSEKSSCSSSENYLSHDNCSNIILNTIFIIVLALIFICILYILIFSLSSLVFCRDWFMPDTQKVCVGILFWKLNFNTVYYTSSFTKL